MKMQEYHFPKEFSWPQGVRIAVMLSFDFQGGEGVRPLKNGNVDHEAYTQAEYGPQTGVWRILELLEKQGVKSTFLTCGAIAERYPDAVRAIVHNGHELAGHGYHHEVAHDLTKIKEKKVIQRTTDMIAKIAGKRPVGWRSCTQSPNSIPLLMEQKYLWNSNSFAFDLPFIWASGKQRMLELPRQPFGDGRIYGRRDSGNPQNALMIWKSLFDELYEESEKTPTFCPFQFHPYVSSRPGRAKVLSELIRHMKGCKGAWFATGTEIAQWCLDREN
jgi:peptidoglycan/xylan/chitin deacetylase (PgdA/CDA1 family)